MQRRAITNADVGATVADEDGERNAEGELDEEFLEQLNGAHESRDQQDADCWQLNSSKLRQLTSLVGKCLWYIIGLFAQVDLFGGRQEDPANVHYARWAHHENFDRRFTRRRLRWWPYVTLPLYALSSLRLANNIWHQYVYDAHFLRQQVFRALTSRTNTADVTGTLRAHLDSHFVQMILAAHERQASVFVFGGGGGVSDDADRSALALLNFSSSIANASSVLELAAGAHARPVAQGPALPIEQSQSPPTLTHPHGVYQHNHNHLHRQQLDLGQLGALLDARETAARATLKRIGAPYIMMTFEIEIIYSFLISTSFVLVILLKLYYRYRAPFDYALVRAFLDFKHERRLFNRLVVRELNRFILSSRNFTLVCVEQSKWLSANVQALTGLASGSAGGARKRQRAQQAHNSAQRAEDARDERQWEREREAATVRARTGCSIARGLALEKTCAQTEANRFLLEHALTKRQLQHMALSGQLQPEHRSARWVDAMSLKVIVLGVCSMSYIFMATLFFAFGVFALSDRLKIDIASYMDVLTICEAGVLVILVVPNATFNIAIIVATCIDQIYYGTSVCGRIRECIATNQRRFIEIRRLQRERQGEWRALDARQRRRRRRWQQQQQQQRPRHSERDGQEFCLRQRSGTHSFGDSSLEFPGNVRERRDLPERDLELTQRRRAPQSQLPQPPQPRERAARQRVSEPAASAPLGHLDRSLSIESRCTQMNADLLRAFVTYKIFVAQMRQTTRSFVTFTLACILVIVLSPLQVRIHSPYFSHFTKIMSMLFSLLGTTAVDVCLIMLCYMFARCTEIYRCLSSLLAHAVEVMNYSAGPGRSCERPECECAPASRHHRSRDHLHAATCSDTQSSAAGAVADLDGACSLDQRQQQQQQKIYDTHTIWLLRKELNFPDRVVSQFAIVAFDFRLTYSNLLRIHFWVGLLTLSIFVDDSPSQEFLGRLFHDPFGVFEWP